MLSQPARYCRSEADAAYIAACSPDVVLALLDERDDARSRGFTEGHAAGRQAAYDGEMPVGYGDELRKALDERDRLREALTWARATIEHADAVIDCDEEEHEEVQEGLEMIAGALGTKP